MRSSLIDQYMTNTLISRPLETPENQKSSGILRGTQNQKIDKKRVKWQDKNNRRLTASKENK